MSNQNETLKKVADTLLDEPVIIKITQKPKYFFQKPKEKEFRVEKLCLGSLIRISKILLSIDTEMFKQGSFVENCMKVMAGKGDLMAEIIAIAIVNRKTSPSKSLINLIMEEFTSADMLTALSVVIKQMDITSFMNSIISIKGTNLLEMSPTDQGRKIAPGVQSEE